LEKIVIINQWASHITKDIANAFSVKYKVALISGQVSESGRCLNSGIEIIKIIKYNRKNKFTRLLTWIIGTIQIILLINIRFKNYHLLLTSNPPLSVFIPLFCKNKYSVQILDIYPDAFVAGGFISKNSWIYKGWGRRNITFFNKARNIFTITESMAATLSQYCEKDRIKVILQWPSFDNIDLINKNENIFLKKYDLTDKFIILYAGNMGLGHHIPTIIDITKALKENREIKFVLIGEGWYKQYILDSIENYELSNCLVLPFQSPEIFRHILQSADLGIVTVSEKMGKLMIPVKTYNLISNHIPLLVITEGDSELKALVDKYKIGKCFASIELNYIIDYILLLKNEKEAVDFYKSNLIECSKLFTWENSKIYVENFIN